MAQGNRILMSTRGGIDYSLRQWILASAGALPATGAVKALVPVDSSTSAFRVALHGLGMSYNDMYTDFNAAYTQLRDYANDTLLVFPGAYSVGAAAVTWAKNYTNVVGVGPAAAFGGRIRITLQDADVATAFTISSRGNTWKNVKFQWGNGKASALTGVSFTYSGNNDQVWDNCAIEGPLNATEGAAAFKLVNFANGSQDFTFRNCYFGVWSVSANQSAGNLIYFAGDQARLLFDRCQIVACSSNGGHVPIKWAGNFSSEGVAVFKDCFVTNSVAATALTVACTGPTAGNGRVTFWNCGSANVSAWGAANVSLKVCSGPTQHLAGGIAVAAA